MTDHVKRFIEENIHFIEKADWRGVFLSWYLHFGSGDNIKDLRYVYELFDVLQTAGIDFLRLTETTRKEFMSNLIDQILHDELESLAYRGSSTIKKYDVLMHIDCSLGFTEQELDKIMEDVGEKKYNLEPDFTCFYVR